MAATAAGRAREKRTAIEVEHYGKASTSLWVLTYLAVSFALLATTNVPTERQEQIVGALCGNDRTEKTPDIRIRQSGPGYIVADGRYEMFLAPQGNVSTDKRTKFIDALRNNIRTARAAPRNN